MRKAMLAAICAGAAIVGGCARWDPERSDPDAFSRACPLQRGPRVAQFGENGVRGVYHFVTQDAPQGALGDFLGRTGRAGFGVFPITINMNGKDTLVVTGPRALADQAQVDAEFEAACALGGGAIYLTHVRYDTANPEGGALRVR